LFFVPGLRSDAYKAAEEALGQIRHPDAIAALVRISSGNVLSDVTGKSFRHEPAKVIAAWWEANREHYFPPIPDKK
jgi:hypothetical protein